MLKHKSSVLKILYIEQFSNILRYIDKPRTVQGKFGKNLVQIAELSSQPAKFD